MSYNNTYSGAIAISPPLTRSQINDPRIARRTDVKLRIVEQKTESEDGESFTVRPVADAIVPLDKEYSGDHLEDDIQLIVDTFPEHGYAGFIEAKWGPGFGEPPSRFIVKDDRVMRIDAQYRWPGIWPDEQELPAGPLPKRMTEAETAAILRDMADRVEAGDSWDGSISYSTDYDGDGSGLDVTATYRTGNLMGQGGMRAIRGEESGT